MKEIYEKFNAARKIFGAEDEIILKSLLDINIFHIFAP